MNFLIQLAIAVVLAVLSYMFMPRPKSPTPDSSQELEQPQADAGMPMQVVFGTKIVKSPNALWTGDVQTTIQKVKM